MTNEDRAREAFTAFNRGAFRNDGLWENVGPAIRNGWLAVAAALDAEREAGQIEGCRWGIEAQSQSMTVIQQTPAPPGVINLTIPLLDPAAVCAERRAGR